MDEKQLLEAIRGIIREETAEQTSQLEQRMTEQLSSVKEELTGQISGIREELQELKADVKHIKTQVDVVYDWVDGIDLRVKHLE